MAKPHFWTLYTYNRINTLKVWFCPPQSARFVEPVTNDLHRRHPILLRTNFYAKRYRPCYHYVIASLTELTYTANAYKIRVCEKGRSLWEAVSDSNDRFRSKQDFPPHTHMYGNWFSVFRFGPERPGRSALPSDDRNVCTFWKR